MFTVQMIVAPIIGLVAGGWALNVLAWTPPAVVFPAILYPVFIAGCGAAVLTMLEPREWIKVATVIALPSVLLFGLIAGGSWWLKLVVIGVAVCVCGLPAWIVREISE